MSKLFGYNTKDDKFVNFTDHTQYYETILQAAFPTTFIKKENLAVSQIPDSGIDSFERDISENISDAFQLIGYLQSDNLHASSDKAIFSRVSSFEEKYYFSIVNNEGAPVKNSNGDIVLNRLEKVKVNTYYTLYFKDSGNRKNFGDQAKSQSFDISRLLPFVVSTKVGYQTMNATYFGVYVNPNAYILILDTDEKTSVYKFAQQADGTFKEIFTFLPGTPQAGLKGDDSADYFANTRYLLSLKKSVNKEAKAKSGKVTSGLKTTVFEMLSKNGESVNSNEITRSIDLILTYFKVPEDQNTAKTVASDETSILPSGYRCFYSVQGENLIGFLSSANIGGGGGGGGYAMRADKVDEVDYRWSIRATGEDFFLAKALSYIMDLDPEKYVKDPNILPIFSDANPNGYYPTNWPSDRSSTDFRNETENVDSWFIYFKKFDPNQTRRNKPAKPNPPRIAHKQAPSYKKEYQYDNRSDFKLDNRKYRIWKKGKGNDFKGMTFEKGVGSTRLSAGSVMGKALNQFMFYANMKKEDALKGVSDASLSATSFAKYVVAKDDLTIVQWRRDNLLTETTPINFGSVTTDQEWCHLFGHGDGGAEELGNFVSGSKHCNTEQLAIETGQRRISQNEDIDSKLRKDLRANITAYLLPNGGSWVNKNFTQDEINKKLLANINMEEVKNYVGKFFTVNVGNGTYTFRDLTTLRNAFKNLSDQIKQAKERDEDVLAVELFQFRRNLEGSFFIFLPVARWIRYKHFFKNKKIFDHIFDAQSQSFDYNEAQILDYTVERVIYRGMGLNKEYVDKLAERVLSIVPNVAVWEIIKALIKIDIGLEQEEKNFTQFLSQLGVLSDLVKDIKFSPDQEKDLDILKGMKSAVVDLANISYENGNAINGKFQKVKEAFFALAQKVQNESNLEPIVNKIEGEISLILTHLRDIKAKLVELTRVISEMEELIEQKKELIEALFQSFDDTVKEIKEHAIPKRAREYTNKLFRNESRIETLKKIKKDN